MTAAATRLAGATATATGTRRPPTPGNQRGTVVPHGRSSPQVSTAPTTAPVANPTPASTPEPSSSSSSCRTPNGMPSAQAYRVAAYPSGTTIAT
ncbi:hypothetical protein [Georgenia sp. MJ170]|uniref:hypothetical protein n=1 Tax=Georgenia sunbinii TaxID=3117728 RepID=UPI002F26DA85